MTVLYFSRCVLSPYSLWISTELKEGHVLVLQHWNMYCFRKMSPLLTLWLFPSFSSSSLQNIVQPALCIEYLGGSPLCEVSGMHCISSLVTWGTRHKYLEWFFCRLWCWNLMFPEPGRHKAFGTQNCLLSGVLPVELDSRGLCTNLSKMSFNFK